MFGLALVVALFSLGDRKASAADCEIRHPVAEVEVTSPYLDEQAYVSSTRDIRRFIGLVVHTADDPQPDSTCAARNLRRWAESNALEAKPSNFEGIRQRIRYAFALNVAAMKLRQLAGWNDPVVVAWLGRLSRLVAQDFARHREERGSPDNLYVWSGVTAAAFLMLQADPELSRYQTRVWQDALSAIGPDGTISLEIKRGQRALLYHAYYLSALLWLQAFGHSPDPDQAADVDRLRGIIVHTLCADPRIIPHVARVQEPPNRTSTVSIQFLDVPFWRELDRCGAKSADSSFAILLGGNLLATRQILTSSQPQQ